MREDTLIHLGFEIGRGAAVEIPLRHMVISGVTQEAGKTTALDALANRSGGPALAFVTKRGEASFSNGRLIPPFFQERVDWEFVESILEAVMKQRMKLERAWIVRAVNGAHSLAEVRSNVIRLLEKAKGGMNQDMYMLLGEYLDKVIPHLARLPRCNRLDLQPGLNVMDLRDYPEELHSLIISSSVRWIHAHENGVVTVIPEVWKFTPQSKNTPVKVEVRKLIREGAALRNYVWFDSQDIAIVEKELLRAAAVWLLGVQRETNEIKRTLENIPEGVAKPRKADIPKLKLGEFFACWGENVRKVFVQPAWMDPGMAVGIALGKEGLRKQAQDLSQAQLFRKGGEEMDYKQLYEQEKEQRETLERKVAELERRRRSSLPQEQAESKDESLTVQAGRVATPTSMTLRRSYTPAETFDNEQLYQAFKARLLQEAPAILSVIKLQPEIEVTVRREKLEMDTDTLDGRVAVLIAENFFDERRGNKDTLNELARRGWPDAAPNVSKCFGRLVRMGFLRIESNGQYKAVDGMKVNVIETV
jgi:hypothetical protein